MFQMSSNHYLTSLIHAVISIKQAKQSEPARYKGLKASVQRRFRLYKQRQLDELCEDLKDANCKGNMRRFFQMTKSIIQKFQPQLHCIQSASGEKFVDAVGIAERWREYCEELYSDGDTKETDH